MCYRFASTLRKLSLYECDGLADGAADGPALAWITDVTLRKMPVQDECRMLQLLTGLVSLSTGGGDAALTAVSADSALTLARLTLGPVYDEDAAGDHPEPWLYNTLDPLLLHRFPRLLALALGPDNTVNDPEYFCGLPESIEDMRLATFGNPEILATTLIKRRALLPRLSRVRLGQYDWRGDRELADLQCTSTAAIRRACAERNIELVLYAIRCA